MNIVHVYDGHERVFPGEGSVPSIVYYLAKYTAKKGHDVTVLERRWVGTDYEEEIDGIRFVRFDLNICSNISNKDIVYDLVRTPKGVAKFVVDRIVFALKAHEFLKREDFDVIHVHLPFAANVLINLNRKLRDRMVYTAHVDEYRLGFSEFLKPPMIVRAFPFDIYLMKRVNRSIVLNYFLKEKLISKGIAAEKLKVIPNGINLEEFNLNKKEEYINKVKAKYKINNNNIIIMFSGSIVPRKGVIYLVKAMKRINNNKALLLMVGNLYVDKNYTKIIINYCKKNNINVRFTGFIPYNDLKALYHACDIFVLPSIEEGFGLVLTEAMASGKPLIGSNVGGIPMQIRDGWNGFLIEPKNDKQLAEKIMYLIENEKERKRMGRNSRKLAEEKFDWSKIAEKYLKVYREVLEC